MKILAFNYLGSIIRYFEAWFWFGLRSLTLRERHRETRPRCTEKLCASSVVVTIIRCILFCFRWNAYGDLIHSAILRVVEKGVVRILLSELWISVFVLLARVVTDKTLCSPMPTLSGQHWAIFQGVYGRLVQVYSSALVGECVFLFSEVFPHYA